MERNEDESENENETGDVTSLLKQKRERASKQASKRRCVMSQPTGLPGGRRVQPIQSLNPYMGASWTIRARVASKGQMRTYNSAKGDGNLFNVEFIDEDGTRIEATLWREVASKYFEVLEEGKVTKRKTRKESPNFHTL